MQCIHLKTSLEVTLYVATK